MLIQSFQLDLDDLPRVKISTMLSSNFKRHAMAFNQPDKSWLFEGFYLYDDIEYYVRNMKRDIYSNIEMWHGIQYKGQWKKDHWYDCPWNFLNPHDKENGKPIQSINSRDVMDNGYIVLCCSDRGWTHIHSDYNDSPERASSRIALMKNAIKTVPIRIKVVLEIYRATSRYFWDTYNADNRPDSYDYGTIEFELDIVTQEWKQLTKA